MKKPQVKGMKMTKPWIKQFFCHYEVLEEYHNGLWVLPKMGSKKEGVKLAVKFMSNTELFSTNMGDVCSNWLNSCAYNFTNPTVNSIAFLGQAAVCNGIGQPESVTREAWSLLHPQSQVLANAAAKSHIEDWYKANSYSQQMEFFDGL